MANPYRDALGRFSSATGSSMRVGVLNIGAQLGSSLAGSIAAQNVTGMHGNLGVALGGALVGARVGDILSSGTGRALQGAGKRIGTVGGTSRTAPGRPG